MCIKLNFTETIIFNGLNCGKMMMGWNVSRSSTMYVSKQVKVSIDIFFRAKIKARGSETFELLSSNGFDTFLAVGLQRIYYFVADAKWSRWSPWTDCSRSCGKGRQSRTRTCSDKATGQSLGNGWCAGKPQQEKSCADWKCPGTFTHWGSLHFMAFIFK